MGQGLEVLHCTAFFLALFDTLLSLQHLEILPKCVPCKWIQDFNTYITGIIPKYEIPPAPTHSPFFLSPRVTLVDFCPALPQEFMFSHSPALLSGIFWVTVSEDSWRVGCIPHPGMCNFRFGFGLNNEIIKWSRFLCRTVLISSLQTSLLMFVPTVNVTSRDFMLNSSG